MSDSDGLDEVVKGFLVESDENLDQLDRDGVAVEQDPTSRDTRASVCGTIHTIKGAGARAYLMQPFTRDAIVEKLALLDLPVEIAA